MEIELLHQAPASSSKGTILLLHGACMGAWCWTDNFLPWFAEHGYDSCAMSLRNHGNSPERGKLTFRRIKEYVEDLRITVEKLNGPVHIIGHSMGGYILQHYLSEPSAKVGKGVLLCSAPDHGSWGLVRKLIREHPFLYAKSNLTMSWLPVITEGGNARQVMFSQHCPEERINYTMKHIRDESFWAFLDLLGLDRPDPKKVQRPLMIVGAEKDYLVPLKDTLKMAKTFGIEPYIIPGAAHNFFMESGWEPTALEILKFLEH